MLARSLARFVAWSNAPRRRTSVSGSTVVEFALIFPILITLMLGTVTAGLAYNDKLSIANAVRDSARLGSAIDYTCATPCGVSPAPTPTVWADSVQLRVQQAYANSASSLALSQICVVLLKDDGTTQLAVPTTQGTSCGTVPDNPTSVPTGSCVVKVWVSKPAKIQLAVLPAINFTISARTVNYYGRTVGQCTTT
jgi:hypothetical protein